MKSPPALCAVLIAVIVFATTCKKDPAKFPLPPITQEGKNTFGFKVNGEDWVPYLKCQAFANPCGQLHTSFYPLGTGFLPVAFDWGATKNTTEDFYESILINTSFSSISQTGDIFDSLYIAFNAKTGYTYESLGGSNNLLKKPSDHFTITKLDTINKIISGTFAFTLHRYQDSIEISDGRFDLKLQNNCECTN